MKSSRITRKIIFILLVLFVSSALFSFSDQSTVERILNENKAFIEFIDVTVTNFAEDKKDEFKDAYSKHFNAEIAFLQSDYKRAYKRIYSSQGVLVKLYKVILRDLYLEDSKNILDKFAPGVIKSKNSRAKLYLTLGYRDRTVAYTHFIIGEASNPKLYSYKIYKFEEAIKMIRRAKKYGYLALFESQKPEIKIKIYNELLKSKLEKTKNFFKRFLNLDEKAFIDELNLTYEQFKKRKKDDTISYENRLEERVRFRKEKRIAKFLINNEFDRVEKVLRRYVDDYNFNLIIATFDVLKNEKSETVVDYNKMKIHLLDNYVRLTKESVMRSISATLKVEDEVSEEDIKKEKEKTEAKKKSVEEKKD
jgi:hypothetical protein